MDSIEKTQEAVIKLKERIRLLHTLILLILDQNDQVIRHLPSKLKVTPNYRQVYSHLMTQFYTEGKGTTLYNKNIQT